MSRALRFAIGLALALAVAGCGDGQGVVLVSVEGAVAGIASLHVSVENAGQLGVPVDLPLPHAPLSIPPAITFSVTFGRDRRGPVTVSVEARDAAGKVLATGVGEGSVSPSSTSDITVLLSRSSIDGGSDGPVDAASDGAHDAGTDAAHDGAALPDLTGGPSDSGCAGDLSGSGGCGCKADKTSCGSNLECKAGVCVCAPGACGGNCGNCGNNQQCNNGFCECAPMTCDDVYCGPDNCGGTCPCDANNGQQCPDSNVANQCCYVAAHFCTNGDICCNGPCNLGQNVCP